jgi:hypothetical protein
MDQVLFSANSATIAGLWFVAGYILGLYVPGWMGKATMIASVVVGLVCCAIRGYSEPLGVAAVASVSVLHICIAALTVLILKNTKPYGASGS